MKNKNILPVPLVKKIILLLCVVLVFTGIDLLVKESAYKNLYNNSDVIIIPGFFRLHYVTNDDIGFSALRWVGKYLGLPSKISKDNFDNKVLAKLTDDYHKELFKRSYFLDSEGKYYVLDEKKSEKYRDFLKELLSNVGYKTSKWLFLVLLQGLGSVAVIVFFFYSRYWRYLIPLALIASGALGNVIDRIIRGFVVDYAMMTIKFIPLPIFNPWPIFNLADIYTVFGAIALFIVMFFFAIEETKKKELSTEE